MENPTTYTFYTETYKGRAIAEQDFPELSERAIEYLDRVTFGRLNSSLPEEQLLLVKKACCAVAEAEQLNRQGGGKAAETVGKYSVSYVVGVTNTQTNAQRLKNAAMMYLGNTRLMYRGVYSH